MAKKTKQPLLFSDLEERSSLVSDCDAPSPVQNLSLTISEPPIDKSPGLIQESTTDFEGLPSPGDTVVVIDAHSLIYQVFHAVPNLTSPKGLPVGAVHGFLSDIVRLREKWHPTYLLCAFDLSEVTFRNEIFEEYKANRESMPEELRLQIPIIRNVLAAAGVPILELAGFEADDILATVADAAVKAGATCLLVTNDKDCRQLLEDRVLIYHIRKDEVFGPAELGEVWGISPNQVVDFQALVGDATDNIPGVPLIGPKLAQQLLEKFGSLDAVLDHPEAVSGTKRQENLKKFRQQALISRELSRLRRDVPIELQWQAWANSKPDPDALKRWMEELGFRKIAEQLLAGTTSMETAGENQVPKQRRLSYEHYQLIDSQQKLHELVQELLSAKSISLDTETTGLNPRASEPVGISLCWKPRHAAYIPLRAPSGQMTLRADEVRAALQPILESESIEKLGQNIKFDIVVLRGMGISLKGISFDSMVSDFLIHAGERSHSLGELAKKWLDFDSIAISELIGSGSKQRRMDEVDLELIRDYACEDAELPLLLRPAMQAKLVEEELDQLFFQIEMPLLSVLAEMEFNGIRVDVGRLKTLDQRFADRLDSLHADIMALAGKEFNPDSPKQLAKVLFEDLKLPVIKKTKTGPSTDVEVLSELATQHPLPATIIEYRQISKLKSTYIDALQELVSPATGRVHTSFRQDVAATGRLSSTDPNLQNIPVRTEEGRSIRSAFIPGEPDWLILCADYSQIELRVLAHFCQDPSLQQAFADDLDVHAAVASQVFGVPLDEVTSAMRRKAKAVNFGIIYGQSPFGLAKSLGISQDEASKFIDDYFAKYTKVKEFIADTLQSCRQNGFVRTLLGRKRWLKGIRDFDTLDEKKRKSLLEPERMAVNTVIQGTAADIIKKAMIDVYQAMKKSHLRARLLLQIHDELLFEVHQDDVPTLADLVRFNMSQAMTLTVPLKVDVKTGPSWSDCEPIH